ncbi:hypothetical protein [Sphingomicrobium lutaoense]|uniref:BMFP domain-containing protein YqiC n=1 Tax=Sphingomicrobium lutaoense TaxID=515949 RepID=A0A839YWW7_9SPHN|nr:hypothetical protein [Sphingomicrobium lutaoense]MBB3762980.1 BMFP domain-containing protein YqiC [Sphingomicrobium lutaoense]
MVLLLSACNDSERSGNAYQIARDHSSSLTAMDARLDELEARVEALEGAAPTIVAREQTAYLLAGSGALEAEGKRFASKDECESEKRSFLDRSRDQAEKARERGVVLTTEPLVSCIALIGE